MGSDAISAGFELVVDTLSSDAFIELKTLLGQVVALHSTLSDGSRPDCSALVHAVLKRDADGGLSRYLLTLIPWSWLLSRSAHSRIFQGRP